MRTSNDLKPSNYLVKKNCESQAAYSFFKRLLKQFVEPRVIVTDKPPFLKSAFNHLKSEENLLILTIEPANI